jgi:RNA polymerase sigma-70 factor (ECF subfamily)
MIALITSTLSDPDDRDYLLWLYNEFYRLMFAEARKYFDRQEDREDVVQEGLLRLCKNVSALRGKERRILAAYVVSVIRNTSITLLKKRKRMEQREVSLDSGQVDTVATEDPPLHEIMERFDDYAQLHLIWAKLTEDDRFLLEGKYILRLSDGELAESLGCQPASIRMKLSRARKHALHFLNELEKEVEV